MPLQFTSLTIQPSYGQAQALVRWAVNQELQAANPEYHLWSSPDGAGDWRRVNSDPVDDLEYLDTDFTYNSRLSIPHYRVLAITDDGTEVEGPVVGLFAQLTRREYSACRQMIRQEYRQIRHDGWRVLHYIPRTRGQIVPGWDTHTDQQTSDCPADQDGYGQKYVGGYRPPFATVLHPQDVGPLIKQIRDDGLGVFDQNKITARMLAFPRPEKGHLIVHPETDNRYVVTEAVKPWAFKGSYPIAYSAQLELLRREDRAYRLPLPTNLDQLVWP